MDTSAPDDTASDGQLRSAGNREGNDNPIQDDLAELNRIFVRTLRMLGDAGERDPACRLAAEGWSRLRHHHPREAERLNGVLHYLTHSKHSQKRRRP